jgi:nucleotide-binding universal stress UspA family protein
MYKRVLVSTDGSKLSGKAVTEAIKLAKTCNASMTVLHVMPDFGKAMSETYAVPAAMAAPVRKKFQSEAAARSNHGGDSSQSGSVPWRPQLLQ